MIGLEYQPSLAIQVNCQLASSVTRQFVAPHRRQVGYISKRIEPGQLHQPLAEPVRQLSAPSLRHGLFGRTDPAKLLCSEAHLRVGFVSKTVYVMRKAFSRSFFCLSSGFKGKTNFDISTRQG